MSNGIPMTERLGSHPYAEVLDQFPHVQHAFAYGSAVFHQPGLYESDSSSTPMLDFIFGVQDPVAWHAENIQRNASHYSFLARLGPRTVTATAERIGAGVYFNTFVPWRSSLIKYGVMRLEALEHDLLTWERLYVAGRMHKPVLPLVTDPSVEAAQGHNLLCALRAALLLLPPRFALHDLLRALCTLSYAGDVRMGLAEDANKIERIVKGSEEALQRMYAGPLRVAEADWGAVQSLHGGGQGGGGSWAQDCSPAAQASLISSLPSAVLRKLAGGPGAARAPGQPPGLAIAQAVARMPQRQLLLRKALASIVASSSRRQALAGVLSAGVWKSMQYTALKVAKAWRG